MKKTWLWIILILVLCALGGTYAILNRPSTSNHQESLLVDAAGKDDLETFTQLAAQGGNLNAHLNAQEAGGLGDTPLTATVLTRGTNVFHYLLSSRVDLEARSRNGDTALMKAVMGGDANYAKIKALVDAGADVNATYDGKPGVLSRAKQSTLGRPKSFSVTNVVQLLLQHGAKE